MLEDAHQCRTAVHEAAHAVMGHLRGQFVRDPGLIANEDGTGMAHTRPSLTSPRMDIPAEMHGAYDASMEMECAVHLAGYVTERRYMREKLRAIKRPWTSPEYQATYRILITYLSREFDPSTHCLIIAALEDFTWRCLRRTGVWETVTLIAEELEMAKGKLDAAKTNTLLNACLPGPCMADGSHRDSPARLARIIPGLVRNER
jgi:hypothetical protein